MSRLAPYKKPPPAREVAILVSPDHALDTSGRRRRLHGEDRNLVIYSSWDRVRPYWRSGHGILVAWAHKKIRWIHPSGAVVHFVPNVPDNDEALEAFSAWREALAERGASPGSMGASATSLFRATATSVVHPYTRTAPKMVVIGGRIGQNAPVGAYAGPIVQWDLPAAYAREIGALRWGGQWTEHLNAPRALDQFSEAGMPVFAHAEITVPRDLHLGPVPRRPRKELTVWRSLLRPLHVDIYPVGKRLRGVWTWEEIMAARDVGCGVKVDRIWLHHSSKFPFATWWEEIQALRALPGYAGFLGKMMGNAFFGQLIVRDDSKLVYRWIDPDGVHHKEKPQPRTGMRPRHIHAAEIVTGRVRANLYTHVLHPAGPAALSWHTDGAWVFGDSEINPYGWERKAVAEEMDFIDAMTYVYRPLGGGKPVWICSGVPEQFRNQTFDQFWGSFTGDWARKDRRIKR
jgi:hypothetical protein